MTWGLPTLTSGQAWQALSLQDKHIDGCMVIMSFRTLHLIGRSAHE